MMIRTDSSSLVRLDAHTLGFFGAAGFSQNRRTFGDKDKNAGIAVHRVKASHCRGDLANSYGPMVLNLLSRSGREAFCRGS